jgi:hypothetical protein
MATTSPTHASATTIRAIARYPGDESTYPFYFDHDGRVVADTWQRLLDDAIHQAAFEYRGLGWMASASPEKPCSSGPVFGMSPDGYCGLPRPVRRPDARRWRSRLSMTAS